MRYLVDILMYAHEGSIGVRVNTTQLAELGRDQPIDFKQELSPSKSLLYSTQFTNCVIYLGELRKINRGNSQSYEQILS